VDPSNGTVRRPPGVRFDTGGATKGLAADLCAIRLEGRETYAVDLGGDIRLGGESGRERRVDISHPWDHQPAHALSLARGAVATSGLSRRVWPTPEGFAHHLLDPATGRPAWTGVVQATAVAETALEAETLAKMALLSGPERARELLHLAGGVLVLDDGEVEVFAARPAAPAPVRHALAGAGAAA
jgi:thiamine biosynthesis lipoprotein